MRLRRVSFWFFPIVLFALGANAFFLVLIKQSYDTVVAAQQHRQGALELANELHQETEQLARLVRAYTATGEPRYLLYYYDILAVRQGEKPAPANFNPRSYWDDVIAGRIKHSIPKEGTKRSVADLMKSQGFSDDELLRLKRVLDATAEMNKIEQIAFAATQGLYNPETGEFVSDGPPRLDFASKLVNSDAYSLLKADLSTAVDGLVSMTDRRTSAEVAAAGKDVERSILLSLLSMGATIVMVVLALRVIRQQVLVPIHRLGNGSRSARGRRLCNAHGGAPRGRRAGRTGTHFRFDGPGDPGRHRPPPCRAEGARGGPEAGGGRDPRQVDVPRQHEPRDPHADERDPRHGVSRPQDRPHGAPARLREQDPQRGQVAAGHHQRHPRFLQGGGRQARARGGAFPGRGRRRQFAFPAATARPREGHRAAVRRGRATAAWRERRAHGRCAAARTGPHQSAVERRQVHAQRLRQAHDRRRGPRCGHRDVALHDPGHRHRHDGRTDRSTVPGVHAGGRLHHAQVRRNRARPHHFQEDRRIDGRKDLGRKRPRRGFALHLHGAFFPDDATGAAIATVAPRGVDARAGGRRPARCLSGADRSAGRAGRRHRVSGERRFRGRRRHGPHDDRAGGAGGSPATTCC